MISTFQAGYIEIKGWLHDKKSVRTDNFIKPEKNEII